MLEPAAQPQRVAAFDPGRSGGVMMRARTALDPDRLLPWACIAAAFAWFVSVALRLPPGDGDLLWQQWLGARILHEHAIPRTLGPETFAAAGAPWTPHEWLFSTALAFSAAHGAPWLIPLACALAAALALATVVVRCRRRGVSPTLSAAGAIVGALAMIQSFGARAQVLGWLGLTVVVTLLELDGPWAWAAVPATVAWANLHASVFLSPAVAALFAVAALLRDRGWSRDVARRAALAAACGAATLATPLGIDLPRYAAGLLASPIRASISEWGATSITSAAFVLTALPLLLILGAFGMRASLRDRLLAAAFTVILFTAVRNVPVFALVVAPVALSAFAAARTPRAERPRARRVAAWATVGAVALVCVLIPAVVWKSAPAVQSGLPAGPARALLAQARSQPRVFCEDFAWCSLFLQAPGAVRFYMDGRCDPYPAPMWRDYREVMDGNRNWATIIERERIDAILVRRDGALDSLLAERPGSWRRIASDRLARLYVKPALLDGGHDAGRRAVASLAR
ncbi:MAG TPA: hypothetical protein VE826_10395 [Dongiaceae bacterium]|nr:hypothetical protein [Dongiaceae bacterium]